jgi:PAS domain-containing protein
MARALAHPAGRGRELHPPRLQRPDGPQLEKRGILPYFQRALRGENSRIPAIRYDAAEPQLAGRARWVEGNLYPVKDAAGEVRQLVLIHEDVTERREAQELILRKSAEFEAVYQHLPGQ